MIRSNDIQKENTNQEVNYCGDERDNELKEIFARLKPTIFCIHGNHEMRPHTIPTYKTKEWNGGAVLVFGQY